MLSKNINELRKKLGTYPSIPKKTETNFFKGVEGITAKLIDYPVNPYKSMLTIALSTWSGQNISLDKWKDLSVDARIEVVLNILKSKTLPAALEAPKFTFIVENLSRSAFDQIVRNRFMAAGSMGWRDNDQRDISFRLPNELFEEGNEELLKEVKETILKCKEVYAKIVDKGRGSWQTARMIIPISACHKFSITIDYRSFREECSRRLVTSEQEDTVASVRQMWKALYDKFPLLAAFCRPRDDWVGRCTCNDNIEFGALFKKCDRIPGESDDDNAIFNKACSSGKVIDEQLGWHYPNYDEWDKVVEEAIKKDRKYFEEE